MATVNLGSIKFNWKGAYSGATAYVVDDVVESGGNSYICIAATTGNTPPNATYWELMASKGTDTSVLTTQGDVLYHDGTSLARLGAGTSGQFLKTQGAGANPSWGTVTTKLVGQTITVYQTALNLGNVNRNATEVTGLATTYTPQSTTSYFIVKSIIHGSATSNHMRATLEWSTDGGSTWSAEWSNTRSGEGLAWSNDATYAYPHFGWHYSSPIDVNYFSTSSTFLKYAPTTPHSISSFKVRAMVFCNDGTDAMMVNRTINGGGNHGNVPASSIEITEYEE